MTCHSDGSPACVGDQGGLLEKWLMKANGLAGAQISPQGIGTCPACRSIDDCPSFVLPTDKRPSVLYRVSSAVIAQASCIRRHFKMSHLPAGALLMFGHPGGGVARREISALWFCPASTVVALRLTKSPQNPWYLSH